MHIPIAKNHIHRYRITYLTESGIVLYHLNQSKCENVSYIIVNISVKVTISSEVKTLTNVTYEVGFKSTF